MHFLIRSWPSFSVRFWCSLSVHLTTAQSTARGLHVGAPMTRRLIVSFSAHTVQSELRHHICLPMSESLVGDEMSFQKLMNYLDSIKVIYGRTAGNVRLAEVTKRQCVLTKQLRYKGCYVPVPKCAKLTFPLATGHSICRRKN